MSRELSAEILGGKGSNEVDKNSCAIEVLFARGQTYSTVFNESLEALELAHSFIFIHQADLLLRISFL